MSHLILIILCRINYRIEQCRNNLHCTENLSLFSRLSCSLCNRSDVCDVTVMMELYDFQGLVDCFTSYGNNTQNSIRIADSRNLFLSVGKTRDCISKQANRDVICEAVVFLTDLDFSRRKSWLLAAKEKLLTNLILNVQALWKY